MQKICKGTKDYYDILTLFGENSQNFYKPRLMNMNVYSSSKWI